MRQICTCRQYGTGKNTLSALASATSSRYDRRYSGIICHEFARFRSQDRQLLYKPLYWTRRFINVAILSTLNAIGLTKPAAAR
jgi:hypothetical protein